MIRTSLEEARYRLLALQYNRQSRSRVIPAKILVNGSPKTGTTWMVRLLASIPGYREIGNFQGVIEQYRGVQAGEIVHGHDHYSAELSGILSANNVKVLLMVRDPRDQAVSLLFHARRDASHKSHKALSQLNDADGLMCVIEGGQGLRGAVALHKLTESWLAASHPLHYVKYEELLGDPVGEFRQVLHYLNISLGDRLNEAIVERNSFQRLSIGRKIWRAGRRPGQEDPSSHFRKGVAGDWRNYFTEDHVRRFKELAGTALIELGYEQDLDW